MWCASRWHRRLRRGLVMSGVVWCVAGLAVAKEPQWQDETHALPEPSVDVVACGVGTSGDRQVWIGGSGRVWQLMTRTSGTRWESALSVRGSDATVHDIVRDDREGRGYAATSEGLYVTSDGGRRWRRTFTGAGRGERAVYHVAVDPRDPQTVWLAAAAGLFVSRDGGASWQLASADLPEGAARWLAISAASPQRLYLITDRGLFISEDRAQHWRQALGVSVEEAEEADENGQAPEDGGEASLRQPRALTSIVVTEGLDEGERLYATSQEGVLVSHDAGATWAWVSSAGLGAAQVRHGLWWHGALHVATDQGVFRYEAEAERWLPVGTGLEGLSVRRLAGDPAAGVLWAATEEGVFRLVDQEGAFSHQPSAISETVSAHGEPAILEVQEAAIRYAEVHPDKIRHWRRAASRKALLPTVSISYDQNRSITDRTDEGSFPAYQVTDEKDRDDNWTFTASWDLGEWVWNDDQTSIDVRSRLMVQLRDDILDEVNRLYFERRRLLALAAMGAPSDPASQVERQMRLEELTAGLDALTGGWFSQASSDPAANAKEVWR